MAKTVKKKEPQIKSLQFDGSNIEAINSFLPEGSASYRHGGRSVTIRTKNTAAILNKGDYLVFEDDKLSAITEADYKAKYEEKKESGE